MIQTKPSLTHCKVWTLLKKIKKKTPLHILERYLESYKNVKYLDK